MLRDYRLYLEDILEAIQKIDSYLHGISFEQFNEDNMRVDAVVRNLEIIGEATKHIPPAMREKYPEIEWRKMAGMRDVMAHGYFSVSLNIVWDVVQNKLPELSDYVARLLKEEAGE
jgi:uncharacterized protein with HEPN domain